MAEGLTREQIVRGAVALLDADGLDGLSMRKLGARLGAGATSLYWHVGNKDGLVALAADAVLGEAELPDADEVGWRCALEGGARSLRALMTRHPWVVTVVGTRADVVGPGVARYQAHTLDACLAAGFTGADLDRAGSAVFAFVLGSAVGEAGPPPGAGDDVLARARDAARAHPRLLERFDALADADPVTVDEESFAFGLTVILDGLALRVPRGT